MVKPDKIMGRREFLKAGAIIGGSAVLGIVSGAYKFQIGQKLVASSAGVSPPRDHLLLPTPSCGDEHGTPQVSEGPFYAPSTPKRIDLRPAHAKGENLRLAGRVLDTQCKPVAGAVLDFWQTDPEGHYDHFNYEYRGHQLTDAEGRYELLTYLPASYQFMGVWRRRHIHMKIAGPAHKFLTTQVFFPFGPDKAVEDISFDKRLVSTIEPANSAFTEARFNFVLETL